MLKFIFSELSGGFGAPYYIMQLGAVIEEIFHFIQLIIYSFLTLFIGNDPALLKEKVWIFE